MSSILGLFKLRSYFINSLQLCLMCLIAELLIMIVLFTPACFTQSLSRSVTLLSSKSVLNTLLCFFLILANFLVWFCFCHTTDLPWHTLRGTFAGLGLSGSLQGSPAVGSACLLEYNQPTALKIKLWDFTRAITSTSILEGQCEGQCVSGFKRKIPQPVSPGSSRQVPY